MPRIVGEERTPRALGTMQATIMIAGMVGPAAGGLLSGWGGSGLVFAVASGCYLAMGAAAMLIRTRRGTAAERAGKENPALLDGLRLIRRDGLVWALVLGALFFITVGEATNVLEVFLARDELGATETQYGLLAASFGLGMASGAGVASRIKTPPTRLRALLVSMALTSAFLGIMALVPNVELLFVAYTAMGAACGVLNACFGAIAHHPDPGKRPRPGHGDHRRHDPGRVDRGPRAGRAARRPAPDPGELPGRRRCRGPGGPGRHGVCPAALRQRGRGKPRGSRR